MLAPSTVDELFDLYERRGDDTYGESLTQMQHALQCAALALRDEASDALVIAALFHDVGHLVADQQNNPDFKLNEDDDDHEALGARILAPLFGPSVALPVSLHVTAKRWRCMKDPTYLEELSAASRATLVAQGGLLNPAACERFENHPGFHDAVTLRTWDDRAKVDGLDVGVLDDYTELVNSLASHWSRAHSSN
jgi:phosphonate degradation associated HDIG domain protein